MLFFVLRTRFRVNELLSLCVLTLFFMIDAGPVLVMISFINLLCFVLGWESIVNKL